MNNYYVYIYLDPRKHGKYTYGSYEFDYEPFYVGKGKGMRYKRIKYRKNPYFEHKINKIKELGLEPIIVRFENLNENKSFKVEKQLIHIVGRYNTTSGPLVNMTDGGEGSSGKLMSQETRNKMSLTHRGHNHPMFGKHHSEKSKRLMSEKKKGTKLSDEHKRKVSQNHADFRGENHPRHKLVKQDVIEIRKLCDEGILTQKEIAKKFKVSTKTIYNIKVEKTWLYKGD